MIYKPKPATFYCLYVLFSTTYPINPKPNTEILPGRKLKFYYGFEGIGDNLCILQQASGKIYPVELQVFDEIENMYVEPFPEEIASRIIEYMSASKHNSWRKEQQT